MSDRVAKSDPDSDGKASQPMRYHQAAWLDHWRHTSHKASSVEVQSHSLHHHGPTKSDLHDSKQHSLLSRPEMATDISKNAQGFREVSESRTVDNMDKSLKMGSKKSGKEILDRQPLPVFTSSGDKESATSKNYVNNSCNAMSLKYQIDLNNVNNSISMSKSEGAYSATECPRECKIQPESISEVPEQTVGPSSKIVHCVPHSGVAPLKSFTSEHDNCFKLKPAVASKQHFMDSKFCSYSSFCFDEEKDGTLLKSREPGSSLSRRNDAPLLIHDRLRKKSQLHSYFDKQSQKVENMSSIRLLPSLGSPEAMESGKGYDGRILVPRIPCSLQDVKTMRISTIVDSVEEFPRCPSRFSQTTHEFFITKKTGANLTEGGQVSRHAPGSLKLKGNKFNGFLSLSPAFGFHGQQGVKLQSLDSSPESEGKDNVGDVRISTVCLKNESSVETDTMELDNFQKSQLSSLALCRPDQNIKGVHDSSLFETENATGEEAGNKMVNSELPDMNEELPALPAVANSTDDGETSTSRTQSLDAEHLLCQAEQPSNSNATPCPDHSLGPDPSSRWVKRLKLSTVDPFARGTKSCNMGEVSSHKKVNMTFRKILNFSKTRPEHTVGGSHVRPKVAVHQTATVSKNGYSTSSDSVRKSQEISLSHSWIRRWCRHKAASPNKKPNTVVLCEPQSSKRTSNELEKKQYPSIAAMALMGKAMSGFHPCEFRRKGSLIVWNT